jgi:hypothetical protein
VPVGSDERSFCSATPVAGTARRNVPPGARHRRSGVPAITHVDVDAVSADIAPALAVPPAPVIAADRSVQFQPGQMMFSTTVGSFLSAVRSATDSTALADVRFIDPAYTQFSDDELRRHRSFTNLPHAAFIVVLHEAHFWLIVKCGPQLFRLDSLGDDQSRQFRARRFGSIILPSNPVPTLVPCHQQAHKSNDCAVFVCSWVLALAARFLVPPHALSAADIYAVAQGEPLLSRADLRSLLAVSADDAATAIMTTFFPAAVAQFWSPAVDGVAACPVPAVVHNVPAAPTLPSLVPSVRVGKPPPAPAVFRHDPYAVPAVPPPPSFSSSPPRSITHATRIPFAEIRSFLRAFPDQSPQFVETLWRSGRGERGQWRGQVRSRLPDGSWMVDFTHLRCDTCNRWSPLDISIWSNTKLPMQSIDYQGIHVSATPLPTDVCLCPIMVTPPSTPPLQWSHQPYGPQPHAAKDDRSLFELYADRFAAAHDNLDAPHSDQALPDDDDNSDWELASEPQPGNWPSGPRHTRRFLCVVYPEESQGYWS